MSRYGRLTQSQIQEFARLVAEAKADNDNPRLISLAVSLAGWGMSTFEVADFIGRSKEWLREYAGFAR